jgi:hypothetical protein
MDALTSDLQYLFDFQMQQKNEKLVQSQIPKL